MKLSAKLKLKKSNKKEIKGKNNIGVNLIKGNLIA